MASGRGSHDLADPIFLINMWLLRIQDFKHDGFLSPPFWVPHVGPKLLGISQTPGPSDLKQAASQLGQQVLDILEPFQGDIAARTLGMFGGKMHYGMSAMYGGMVI